MLSIKRDTAVEETARRKLREVHQFPATIQHNALTWRTRQYIRAGAGCQYARSKVALNLTEMSLR